MNLQYHVFNRHYIIQAEVTMDDFITPSRSSGKVRKCRALWVKISYSSVGQEPRWVLDTSNVKADGSVGAKREQFDSRYSSIPEEVRAEIDALVRELDPGLTAGS